MSDQNIEIVRRWLEAWNARDYEAMSVYTDPEIELDRSRSMGPSARVYRGPEVADMLEEWFDTWESFESIADQLIAAGDQVVVLGRFTGTGRKSGAPVEAAINQVCTLCDGKIVRHVLFQSKAEAFEAAGLPEP